MKLTYFPDPLLNQRCREITADELANGTVEGHNFLSLFGKMVATMRTNNGCGLAAPQVGLAVRLFVVDATGHTPVLVMNPVLEDMKSRAPGEEGCLSIPGVHGYVMRAERLILRGIGVDLKPIEMKVKDTWLARILQHENDHLDGQLFIDKMSVSDQIKAQPTLDRLKRMYRLGEEDRKNESS